MSKKDKKKTPCKPLVKRFAISIILALFFGLLCSYLAWSWDPKLMEDMWFWGWPLMLSIMFNRLLIWFAVTFSWFMTKHPLFWFKMYPVFRWAIIWAFVSIDIIFGPFIMDYQQATLVAWMTVLAGAFYGMVIDMVATKFAWDGEDLLKWLK